MNPLNEAKSCKVLCNYQGQRLSWTKW